ncbi:hypothetical protein HK100_006816 [Physocladia obscura]|uniref:Complex 1 LYR protein domain-containing protein n=1 Tax=Physocladia obscura TaxID=109957 RepID=A0AAD5SSN5_9FUNG|nr:hypothetical protein HK100_006816 [Physocladia obscura]
MTTTLPTRAQALELYRALLRSARQFSNYNFRNYVARRATDAFRANQTLSDSAARAAAYANGLAELGVARRQGAIDAMYRSERLVVEKTSRPSGYNVYRE